VQRHLDDVLDPGGRHRRLAGRPAGLLEQARDACGPIALAPQPHRRLAGLQAARHRDRAEPVRAQQHDPRPPHVLLGRVAVLHEVLQPVAIVRRQVNAFTSVHAAQESHPRPRGKDLIVTEH
jgi:hypothetical protein